MCKKWGFGTKIYNMFWQKKFKQLENVLDLGQFYYWL